MESVSNPRHKIKNLSLFVKFYTDGDFYFEDIPSIINRQNSLYQGCKVNYIYSDENPECYKFFLSCKGESYPCRWAARDFLEGLMCALRTSRYYVIMPIYNMLIDTLENHLFKAEEIQHETSIDGNYEGSRLILKIKTSEV